MKVRSFVLMGSIMVNVALISYVATRAWVDRPSPTDRAIAEDKLGDVPGRRGPSGLGGRDFQTLRLIETLPETDKRQARAAIGSRLEDLRRISFEARRKSRDFHAALTSEDFDPDALAALSKAAVEARARQQAYLQETVVLALAALSPEARADIGKAREDRRARRREHRRRNIDERLDSPPRP